MAFLEVQLASESSWIAFIVICIIKMDEQEEYAVLSKAAYDWYHGDHQLAHL